MDNDPNKQNPTPNQPTQPATPAQPAAPTTPESTPQPTPPATPPTEPNPATTPAPQPSTPPTQPAPGGEDKVVQVGKYQVKVLRNICIGAASCVAVSPNVFELDNENKAVVKSGANDLPDNILMAAQSCPTKAIVITDTETGKQVWPA